MLKTSRIGCYDRFIREASETGLATVLNRYPVALEMAARIGRFTRDAAEDFTRHWEADRGKLGTLIGSAKNFEIASISVGLSEPHRQGRTVIRVTMTDGRNVFYKPRSLAVDVLWARFLSEFNQRLSLPLLAPRVLDAGDHGWAEAIPTERDLRRDDARRFFHRYGSLLCLAWTFDAVDLHCDNIIASGEHPVAVDLECVMHPFDPGEEPSLVRTGILPNSGSDWDSTGLGEFHEFTTPQIVWTEIDTDDLQMNWHRVKPDVAKNLPTIRGAPLSLGEVDRAFTEGFESTARMAKMETASIAEWRDTFSKVKRRRLYRPTVAYEAMVRVCRQPSNLISWERWTRTISMTQGSQLPIQITESERAQLATGDIPAFEWSIQSSAAARWADLAARLRELRDARLVLIRA